MNPELITIHVGKKIKEHRTFLKLSKIKFSKIVGLSVAQIENIERGRHSPTITGIFLFCRVFGCQPNDLLPIAVKIEMDEIFKMSKTTRINKIKKIERFY